MDYPTAITFFVLVSALFWQRSVIHKTERERDLVRLDLSVKLCRAQAEIRALEDKLREVEP